MGKIKESHLSNLNDAEIDEIIYKMNEDEERKYQEWITSDEYIQFVNEQLAETNPVFSTEDIKNALDWAKSAINVEPTDIGKDIYDILFIEKVEEHLNKIRYDKF
jgi:hypothetical protein